MGVKGLGVGVRVVVFCFSVDTTNGRDTKVY